MAVLSYNIQLLTKNQEDFLKIQKILELNLFAWNEISKVQYLVGSKMDRKKLHLDTYFPIRKAQPEIPSQVIIRAQNDVRAAYRSIISNRHKIEGPIVKKKLSMRLDKRLYRLKGESIFLTTLEKRIECKFAYYPKFNDLLSKYPFGDPLIFIRDSKLWASVSFKIPDLILSKNPVAVGVDLGIKNFAALSDGTLFQDKKYLKDKRKLRYLKRELKSKGTKTARKHLKKIRNKEFNRADNQCHLVANKVLETTADVIVLEDLGKIKENCKKGKKYNNKFSQVPVAKLGLILKYKAPLKGKTVQYVNPAYTSQIDSRTGKKDGVRKGSIYIGKDGILLHADINAAINIAIRSKLPILRGNPSYWQAVVNRPNVCKSILASKAGSIVLQAASL